MIRKYQGHILPKGKHIKTIHDQAGIGMESTKVVDDNTNHRGARMVFIIMNPIDTWGSQNVDDDHDTLCRGVLEDVIE